MESKKSESAAQTNPLDAKAHPDAHGGAVRDWAAVAACAFIALLADFNLQAPNAALAEIGGSLSAGVAQMSWISIVYLTAGVVTIVLSGWLSARVGLRRYLAFSGASFLTATIACGMAPSLEILLIARAAAGLAGAAFVPATLTLVLTRLPRRHQPVGMALFTLAITQASSLGPALGGWLAEAYNWRLVFHVQILPLAVALGILWRSQTWGWQRNPRQPPSANARVGLLVTLLVCSMIVLEEGHRRDWMDSGLILVLCATAAVSMALFVLIEQVRPYPVLDLRLLRDRCFAVGTLLSVTLGLGLFGNAYLVPLYLTHIQAANPQQIGAVMLWTGLPQLVVVPLVVLMIGRVDARSLVGLGMVLLAAACFMNVGMTHDVAHLAFMGSNAVRAVGQALVLIPLYLIATQGISDARVGSASALFNGARLLGGAVGISLATGFLMQQQFMHSTYVRDSVSFFEPGADTWIRALATRFAQFEPDPSVALRQALATADTISGREALVLSFNDAFFVLGIVFLASLALVPFLRRRATATSKSAPTSYGAPTSCPSRIPNSLVDSRLNAISHDTRHLP